jgi:hypothetical protein
MSFPSHRRRRPRASSAAARWMNRLAGEWDQRLAAIKPLAETAERAQP